MFDDRVRYKLISEEYGELVLSNDPISNDGGALNWFDIPRTIERGRNVLSFMTTYIEQLTFIKEGASYLRRYFDQYAPNGRIFLEVAIRNPITDIFEVDFIEDINMQEFEDVDEKVTVKIISGGLQEQIDAQLNEKYELDRTTFKDGEFTTPTDIDGNEISDLEYQTLALPGRRLFNRSFLENKESFTHIAESEPALGINTTNFISDHNIIYESDDSVHSVIGFDGIEGGRKVLFNGNWLLTNGQFFYGPSDRTRTLKITFTAIDPTVSFGTNSSGRSLTHYLVIAKEGNPGEYAGFTQDHIVIKQFNGSESNFSFKEEIIVNLKKDEVLAFVTNLSAQANGPSTYSVNKKSIKIFIEEDSEFPATTNNCLRFKDAIDRITEIITGKKGLVISDFFTNGIFKDLVIAGGKMIRNIPKLNEDQEPLDKLESLTISLKDLMTIDGYLASGYGVEKTDFGDRVVVEDLRYFFQNVITIDLGEVYDYKETLNKDYLWGGAEFGNDKAGEYEEQFGLFETNAKNAYGFPTTKVEEIFDGISKLRSDLIAVEFLRRKNIEIAPTEDTPYDKENFIFDSKIINNVYTPRVWQDDLESKPTKLYDPDSAGNFRLSPLQSMLRWSWFFGSSLYKYPEDYVRYKSSTGYSGMITKYPDKPERSEDGNIQIKEFDTPRISSKSIECSTKLTYNLRKQILGSTTIKGRKVPNVYCLARYTYKNKEAQYGWILKAELTRQANFKLIKALI
ncbi:hypothetical protein [Aquimarina sp. 2201CG5-10]|uniref:hypothetical protein n=1 Tax=Aquimarina callyspongiae TaxID=3098150 RepID=UPI002AB4DF89|nr:hypothetical protein [Aquimarina sp. 2201CG5-10]MDY8137558.1 hypothetical protein [Aquimarina sp. 2201CG5-10]